MVIFSEGLCKIAEQYLKKGSKVYLEGSLQTRKWTDKDGADKYSTEVVLQNFNSTLTMLDRAGGGGGGDCGIRHRRFRRRLRLRPPARASRPWPAPAASAATWTTKFRSRHAGWRPAAMQTRRAQRAGRVRPVARASC